MLSSGMVGLETRGPILVMCFEDYSSRGSCLDALMNILVEWRQRLGLKQMDISVAACGRVYST